MKARLDGLVPILEYFNNLSVRERVLVLVATLVVVHMAWEQLLMNPLQREQQRSTAELEQQRQRLNEIDARTKVLVSRYTNDPDAGVTQELEQLRAQINTLDERIDSAAEALIDPPQMARVLEQLLNRENVLRLMRLETLAPKALNEEAAEQGENNGLPMDPLPNVYEHGFVVEFEGDYRSTVRYMHALEALPWRIFWDGIEFHVDDYPLATVRLHMHTLSLSEAWIGV